MAVYELTSPQGEKYHVTAPDDATQDQVMQYFQQNLSNQKQDQGSNAGPVNAALYGEMENIPGLNKAADYIGAAGAKGLDWLSGSNLFNGQSISDLAKQSQANTQQTESANPVPYYAGMAAAGIPMALLGNESALASLAKGGLIPNASNIATKGLNMLSKPIVGGIEGSALGALYGAGNSPIGQELQGAKSGAEFGGGVGAAIPAAGAVLGSAAGGLQNMVRGVMAKDPEALQAAANEMYKSPSAIYQKISTSGAAPTETSLDSLSTKIDDAVGKTKLIPELQPKTGAIVNTIKNAIEKGDVSISDLDQYRRLLGTVTDPTDNVAASSVRRAIDDYMWNLQPHDMSNGSNEVAQWLQQARQEYSQASKFDDIATIIRQANGNQSKIKSGLNRFLNNDAKTRGFTNDEVKALREASQYSPGEGALTGLGQFGIDTSASGLAKGSVLSSLLGAGAGGPVGLAALAGGTISKQAGKAITRGKAENLLNLIKR